MGQVDIDEMFGLVQRRLCSVTHICVAVTDENGHNERSRTNVMFACLLDDSIFVSFLIILYVPKGPWFLL